MGRLPTNLQLLEAEVRECGEGHGSLALIVAGQIVILPPWVSYSVSKPREYVRVLIRTAPDGGVDPLVIQRSEEHTLIPLSPRIAPEVLALGAAILLTGIFAQVWWLLAIPGSLALVQWALRERRRRALGWFSSAETTCVPMPPISQDACLKIGRSAAGSVDLADDGQAVPQ
jgi:hypothetical protein